MSIDAQFLSARLVHDEVQPQAERAAGGAAGHRRRCTRTRTSRRSRGCCSCSSSCRRSWPRSPACTRVSLQPAAGAQGELTALMVAAAYFRDRGERRTKVLIPDSAHGTNPASAAPGRASSRDGQEQRHGPGRPRRLRGEARRRGRRVHDHQPEHASACSTRRSAEIAELLHDRGALLYLDGANMNAILGVARPGRLGRRPDALQPAQDLLRPARRRRPRRRADRRPRPPGALPARADGRPTRRRDLLASTTTARSRSAGSGPSSATSACWSGPTATSGRRGPTA